MVRKRVLVLSEDERNKLRSIIDTSFDSWERKRAHAILLYADNYPNKDIVRILNIAKVDTIRIWTKGFSETKFDAIKSNYSPGRPRKIDLATLKKSRDD